jgi:hypothetical protein
MHEHQKLVAKLAKNDTDDVEEIEGRKLYRIYNSFNKFLRISLVDHIERNINNERIYLMLKKITVCVYFFKIEYVKFGNYRR